MSNNTLLERLLSGKEFSACTTVEDTLEQSGVPLLREFIRRAQLCGQPVIGIQLDPTLQVFDGLVAEEKRINVAVVALDTEQLSKQPLLTIIDAVKNACQQVQKPLVVIDAITDLLLTQPQDLVFSVLSRLVKDLEVISGSLLLGVQADLPLHAVNNSAALQPSYLAGLAREVTTRLQINNRIRTESRDIMGASFLEEHAIRCMPDDNAPLEALCTIQHRRKTGKITQETVHLTFDQQGHLVSIINYERRQANIEPELAPSDTQPDPTANLPFNLKLTEEQRAARDQVVLPYLKAQEGIDGENQDAQTNNQGFIYYTPDTDDDFDEEDPDDDLDI